MKELDPLVWFSNREVSYVPPHFTKTNTPHSDDAYRWVITTLRGRFGISSGRKEVTTKFSTDWVNYFYFEDPAEAMMYELRWSGS
jgi:hypothetical protein